MKLSALSVLFKNRVPFRLSENLRVPEIAGCYILANIDDDILYIGQTIDVSKRMQQHLSDPRMIELTSMGLASWFYWGIWPTNEIRTVEERLLFNFKAIEGRLPPLNRTGP